MMSNLKVESLLCSVVMAAGFGLLQQLHAKTVNIMFPTHRQPSSVMVRESVL